jgi:hypothetical protein
VVGANPVGTWELVLADTAANRAALRDGTLNDVMFVLSYGADLPPRP